MWASLAWGALGCGDARDTTTLKPLWSLADFRLEAYLDGRFPTEFEPDALPQRLSDTGAFTNGGNDELQPSPGLIPYEVNAQLWSDGLVKRRWAVVPAGEPVRLSAEGPWEFPPGSVLIKEFDLPAAAGSDQAAARLETRFIVTLAGGDFYGVTYRWDEALADGVLLLESEHQRVELELGGGDLREQVHLYPGVEDCRTCHNSGSGILGLTTAQLNREIRYPGAQEPANQLAVWTRHGLLSGLPLTAPVTDYPRLAPLGDESASVEHRLESYWAANCSMCHRPDASLPSWDASFGVPMGQRRLVDRETYLPQGGLLVESGRPARSDLFRRAVGLEPETRMPPLGSVVEDTEYSALLWQWIRGLNL